MIEMSRWVLHVEPLKTMFRFRLGSDWLTDGILNFTSRFANGFLIALKTLPGQCSRMTARLVQFPGYAGMFERGHCWVLRRNARNGTRTGPSTRIHAEDRLRRRCDLRSVRGIGQAKFTYSQLGRAAVRDSCAHS
jgi:hypothetical protein